MKIFTLSLDRSPNKSFASTIVTPHPSHDRINHATWRQKYKQSEFFICIERDRLVNHYTISHRHLRIVRRDHKTPLFFFDYLRVLAHIYICNAQRIAHGEDTSATSKVRCTCTVKTGFQRSSFQRGRNNSTGRYTYFLQLRVRRPKIKAVKKHAEEFNRRCRLKFSACNSSCWIGRLKKMNVNFFFF